MIRSAPSPCTAWPACGGRSRPALRGPSIAANLNTGQGGLFYTGSFHQLGVQALGLQPLARSPSAPRSDLFVMDKLWGIRVDEHAEIEGLDLAEHGTFGIPEFGVADPSVDGGSGPRGCIRR